MLQHVHDRFSHELDVFSRYDVDNLSSDLLLIQLLYRMILISIIFDLLLQINHLLRTTHALIEFRLLVRHFKSFAISLLLTVFGGWLFNIAKVVLQFGRVRRLEIVEVSS